MEILYTIYAVKYLSILQIYKGGVCIDKYFYVFITQDFNERKNLSYCTI